MHIFLSKDFQSSTNSVPSSFAKFAFLVIWLVVLLFCSGSGKAQMRVTQTLTSEKMTFRGTYHYATKTFVANELSAQQDIIFNNTNFTQGFFTQATPPQRVQDWGTSPGGMVQAFQIGYATSNTGTLDMTIIFYQGTTDSDTGNVTATFDLTGLPGSDGGLQGLSVNVDITGGGEFTLPEGPFGYAYQTVDADGPLTADGGAGITDFFRVLPDTALQTFSSNTFAQFWMQVSGVSNEEILPPPNDECSTATIVDAFPFSDTLDTRGATNNPNDPMLTCNDDGNQTDGKTVWYKWTPTESRTVNLSTDGSNYDTVHGVFTGACGDLTEVACVDLFITDNLIFDAQAGVTYFIKVGEFQGGSGAGTLVFSIGEPPLLAEGPANGSITGGGSVSTDDFATTSRGKFKAKHYMMPPEGEAKLPVPPKKSVIAPLAPVGSNFVEDLQAKSISKSDVIEPQAPVLKNGFAGIPDDANSAGVVFIPPDPIIAAGLNQVVACVNTDFAIFDKQGNELFEADATKWFENVLPGLDPGGNEPFGAVFDPQIVYDHFHDRWIMLYVALSSNSAMTLLSVSDDSDPMGTWCNWALPANQNGSTVTNNFGDYPKLGYDDQAIYIMTNQFDDFANGGFEYVQIRIVGTQQLYDNNCGPVTWTDFWNLRNPSDLSIPAFTTVPAVTFGTLGVEYLVGRDWFHNTGTFMNLWSLTDPLGTPSLTAVTVPVTAFNNNVPDADQKDGSATPINVGGSQNRNVVYRDGSVWTAHSIGDANGDFALARYVRIDVNTRTVMEDAAFGANNFWYYYPAVMVDENDNVHMTFTRSGLVEYASARYTGKLEGDSAGLQPSALLKAGEANYVKTFGDTRNRWGDYSGIALDPSDNSTVWMFTEYAASPANTWGTWVGSTSYTPLSGAQIGFDPDTVKFEATEVGSTSLSIPVTIHNFGDAMLTVTDISFGNPAGSFTLDGLPTLPVDIPSFGAVEFDVSFSPTSEGIFTDVITVSSNDVDDPSVTMAVVGFTPANIALSTSMLDVSVESGQVGVGSFSIQNTGGNDLTFDIGFTGIAAYTPPPNTPSAVSLRVDVEIRANFRIFSQQGKDVEEDEKDALADEIDPDFFTRRDEYVRTLQAPHPTALFQFDVSTEAGEALALAVEFDGTFFWVAGGGATSPADPNRLFKYDVNGNLVATFNQGTTSQIGWTDLARDGAFLYGLDRDDQRIDQIDPATATTTGVTIPSPLSGGRALAYDPANDHFWISGRGLDIIEIDRSGNTINTFPNSLGIRGLGWDDVTPGGPYLWAWSDDGNGTLASLFNPSTGTFTGHTFDGVLLPGSNIAGGATFTTELPTVPQGVGVLVGLHQDNNDTIIGYAVPPAWLRGAAPNSGVVASQANQMVDVTVDALGLTAGNYTGGVVVGSSDSNDPRSVIQVNLEVTSPTGKQIRIEPVFVDFDTVGIGQTSAAEPLRIFSVGSENLTISAISDPGSDFVVSGTPTLPAVVAPGDTIDFSVAFVPTSEGEVSGTITVTSDDQDDPVVDVSLTGAGKLPVSVTQPTEPAEPVAFGLEQNYPNPFNPETRISYQIPERSHVRLTIFNLLGQAVRTLVDEEKLAHSYVITWNGRDDAGQQLPSGVYVFQLQAGKNVQTKKMLFLK